MKEYLELKLPNGDLKAKMKALAEKWERLCFNTINTSWGVFYVTNAKQIAKEIKEIENESVIYDETTGIKKLRDGLTLEILKSKYDWILEADIKDAVIGEDKNGLVWYNGVWGNGTWQGGTWERGTWERGYWQGGYWKGGVWKRGVWYNGYWEGGTWEGGTWESGTWERGTWSFGVWKYGTWERGTWESGTWESGTWKGGYWQGGYWKGGVWERGYWESGTWCDENNRKPV